MSSYSSRSKKTAAEPAGEIAAAVRHAPTAWRFRLEDCPHPRYATSRWQMPGRDREEILDDGAWWVSIEHAGDGPYTGCDQRIEDDPQGRFSLMMSDARSGRRVGIVLGNALARMYTDRMTAPNELADLHGGIGYFADASRLCRWLALARGPERQRRMAVCIEPSQYRAVLLTKGGRLAAAKWVHEQILTAELGLSPQAADGFLRVITDSASEMVRARLYRLTAVTVCSPHTGAWWRERLVSGLIDAHLSTSSPHDALVACALSVVTNDQVEEEVIEQAEILLHGNVPHGP